jgi:hypothetical protein
MIYFLIKRKSCTLEGVLGKYALSSDTSDDNSS